MKRSILTIILFIIPFLGYTQGIQTSGAATQLNEIKGGSKADSAQWLPKGYASFPWFDSAARIWYNPSDSSLYYHTGHRRVKVGSGGGGGSDTWGAIQGNLSDQTDLYDSLFARVLKSDSLTLYLTHYQWKADSALIMSNFQLYMRYQDTANILAPYLRKVDAATLYYSVTNPSGYITNAPLTDTADSIRVWAQGLFYPLSNPNNYTDNIPNIDSSQAIWARVTGLTAYGISPTDITHWNTAYNKYPVSATFNAAMGNYTITLNDATTIVTSFDGRYLQIADWQADSANIQSALAGKVSESKYQADSAQNVVNIADTALGLRAIFNSYVKIGGNSVVADMAFGTLNNYNVNILQNNSLAFHAGGYVGMIMGTDTLYLVNNGNIGFITQHQNGGLNYNYEALATTGQNFNPISINAYLASGGKNLGQISLYYTGNPATNDRTSEWRFITGSGTNGVVRQILGPVNVSTPLYNTYDWNGLNKRYNRDDIVTIDNRSNTTAEGGLRIINNLGQTKNAITVAKYDSATIVSYIDPNGKGGFTSLALSNVRSISTNATVNDTDNYININSSAGAVSLTLNTSTYKTGHEWRIFKTTSDTNTITLTPTTGIIQGNSSFTLSQPYASITLVFDGTNYWIAGYNNGSVSSTYAGSLTASRFGIKNDLKHGLFSFKTGSDTIISSASTFLSSDTGKLIAIHHFRLKPTYWYDTATVVAKITKYINGTTVLIDSTAAVTRNNAQGYYYTNNCDAMYNMVQYCKAAHIGHIHWDLTDTSGSNWHYSKIGPTLGNNRYFPLYNLTIQGNADANIKFCDEDDLPTDSASAYVWGAFMIDTVGGSGIEDINLISPDRSTPNVTKQNITAINAAPNLTGELNINNVNICGDGLGDTLNNPNWKHEWGTALNYPSVAGAYNFNISNTNLWSDFENISIFTTADNINSTLNLRDVNLYYSGCPEESRPMYGAATILAGSDTVHLSGISNSWYKYTSEIGMYYHKPLRIVDSVNNDSFNCNMVTILDPHTLIIDVNAPATFSNVTIKPFSGQNMSQGEGHSMYIHPNSSVVFNNVSVYGANCLALQRYSAGGVHNGAYLNIFNHCNSYTYDGISPNGNTQGGTWLFGHQGPYTFYVRDCDSLYYYDNGQPINMVAWNTHFGNAQNTFSPTIHANSEFHNCSGGVLTIDNSAKVLIDGGTWYNITANKSSNGDTLIIKNANVDLLYTLDSSRYTYTATYNTYVKRQQGTYPVYNYTGEYGSLRTANFSINLYDTDLYVNASAPSAMVTLTLPTTTTRVNKIFHITKTSGNYPIKIAPASGLIDSQSAIYLSRPNASVAVRFDGVNYTTISYSKSSDSTTATGGGSGTVTSVATSKGILGGTITTSGTLYVDTIGTSGTAVASQAWVTNKGYLTSYTETDPVYSANGVPKTTTVNGHALSSSVSVTYSDLGNLPLSNLTPGTSAQILINNATPSAVWATMSGDATISNTGVITLKNTGTAGTYGDATHVPQITTDAQGRVTSVTAVAITGGGGGTPGGSSGNLQYNNSGALGGLSNANGGSDGFIQHTGQTTGAVAASSTATIAKEFDRILAGHHILATIDTTTGEILYQPHSGMKNISHFWGWALFGDGIWNSFNTGSAGTSSPSYSATNLASNISVRTLPTSSTAGTSNGVYVCSPGQGFFTSSTRYGGGMFMIATFTMNTYNANQRFFCGFSNTAGCSLLTNADQSTVSNTIGINKDVADATFQFLTKGTGTALKTNTTITPNSNDMYRAIIFVPSNSTTVYEALIHYTVSGWDMQTFSTTTNIPAAGVQMYPTIWVNNGSTAAVRTIGVDNIYTETDF